MLHRIFHPIVCGIVMPIHYCYVDAWAGNDQTNVYAALCGVTCIKMRSFNALFCLIFIAKVKISVHLLQIQAIIVWIESLDKAFMLLKNWFETHSHQPTSTKLFSIFSSLHVNVFICIFFREEIVLFFQILREVIRSTTQINVRFKKTHSVSTNNKNNSREKKNQVNTQKQPNPIKPLWTVFIFYEQTMSERGKHEIVQATETEVNCVRHT